MNTRTDSKSNTLESREALIAKLDALEPVCADLLAVMPASGKELAAKDIQFVRRDLLKAHNKVVELETLYVETLGLDFVSEDEAPLITQVADDRKVATDDYFRALQLESRLQSAYREFSSQMTPASLAPLSSKLEDIKVIRQGLFALYWALPDLGMTYDEWNSLSPLARRGLRPMGRPALPLECKITQANLERDALLAEVDRQSGGELNTLEKAVEGVVLSAAGRPSISPIGKDERAIGKLKRDLAALKPEDFPSPEEVAKQPRLGDTYDMRVTRIKGKIADLEARVRAAEDELTGVDKLRRQFEKLRARHRDLVLAEANTSGKEQASLLLETLQNEYSQQVVFEQIHQLDPNAKETLTHKVNPRETKSRIARLKMNGQLDRAEQLILQQIAEKIVGNRRSA
ncbi:hypothetical protein RBE51_19385 [Pseudomonas taiwanensis]|uniref:hypothetical protein n=1 Tax=Pseudomonas taiwanensis TaxID=470150 RepID=UPI0028DFD1DD|nr:hypothetical protein [Pseudomonas taiwanensis]MDT8924954.1 hypothetical protein [Pseudomonas taiwanensis]